MTRKQRSLLFLAMLFIFLVSGPAMIFYSQGYRISSGKIVKTGAIYFITSPRNSLVQVSSENKTIRKTTNFFGTAFIENLLPERYLLEVSKENYYPWQKTVEINEKMALDFKNITLIPEDPEFKAENQEIKSFFYFPENNSLVISDGSWISLYNKDPFFQLKKDSSLEIIQKQGSFIVQENNQHYLLINEKIFPLLIKSEKVSFHPEKNNEILYLEGKNLFSYNYQTQKSLPVFQGIITYEIRGDNVLFVLTEKGEIIKNIDNPSRLSKTLFEIKPGKEYQIVFPNSSEIMIKENNVYYLFDKKELVFKEVFQALNHKTSPDFKKTAYHTDYEIGVLFLDNILPQPQRKYQDNVFLTRFSEKIDNLYWYTSHYLVFTVAGEVKIMEIDNRDQINIVSLAQFKNPKMFFSYPQKRIYVLDENKLFVSKKLVP
jgi:hypothetical protein